MLEDLSAAFRDLVQVDARPELPVSCFEYTCSCRSHVVVTSMNGVTHVSDENVHLLPYNQAVLSLRTSTHLDPDEVAEAVAPLLRYTSSVIGRDVFRCLHCFKSLKGELSQELSDALSEEEWRTRLLASIPSAAEFDSSGLCEDDEVLDTNDATHMASLLEQLRRVNDELLHAEVECDAAAAELDVALAQEVAEVRVSQVCGAARRLVLDGRRGAQAVQADLRRSVAALSSTSALNEAFLISRVGPFAAVNGHRLGRLKMLDVPWWEVNAALGHLAHLVLALSERFGVSHSDFAISLCGSMCTIEAKGRGLWSGGSTCTLFGGAQGAFSATRLDGALDALLAMTAKLAEAASPAPTGAASVARLGSLPARPAGDGCPCQIDADRVNGLPLHVRGSSMETWTRSLRYICVVLKWLVGRAALMAPQQERPRVLSAEVGPWLATTAAAES